MTETNFALPAGLMGKFGVIKLWPGIKVAEDEVIARLKLAATKLGLTCYEISADGHLIDSPNVQMTQKDLDFVIHLHFETPKAYDIFSFVALWNPLQFYHDYIEGAYRRLTNNLLSHDDFLSCGSQSADDHVRRLLAHDKSRSDVRFNMYHSLAEPIIAPTLGEQKLFYAGINWERLGRKPSRHQELLDLLDKTGSLAIYGPTVLQGVKVWDGYKSYRGQIPFDGITMVKEIARSGISLVLSSGAHKEAGLMSSRLFESLAAGAVIICDDNPFASRHFGDSLLYIDCTAPADETANQVREHLLWIKNNPQEALKKARDAQEIFKAKFTLDRSLAALYTAFPERRAELRHSVHPETPEVYALLNLPDYDQNILRLMLENIAGQSYPNIKPVLLTSSKNIQKFGTRIEKAIADILPDCTIHTVDFMHRLCSKDIGRPRPFGQVLQDYLRDLSPDSLFMVIQPREQIFSDHIQILVSALQENPNHTAAGSAIIQKKEERERTHYRVEQHPGLSGLPHSVPFCSARLLIRNPTHKPEFAMALPYLDKKVMALFATTSSMIWSSRTTMIQHVDPKLEELTPEQNKQVAIEDMIIQDYLSPDQRLKFSQSDDTVSLRRLEPDMLSLNRLTKQNRAEIARDIFLGIPMPKWCQNSILSFYHFLRGLR